MPLSESDCAATFKVLVLGDSSVGKSALLRCLTGKEFRDSVLPTVATDFVKKKFEVDGALVELQIWDTAGQPRFHSINRWQYRGVKGVALVYDITDRRTFENLSYWLQSVNKDICQSHNKYEAVPVVLLGNKSDLDTERKVNINEGLEIAEMEMAFDFFETSARTGTHVFDAFRKLAYHVTDICNPEVMMSYHRNMIREKQSGPPPTVQTRTTRFRNTALFKWTKKTRNSTRNKSADKAEIQECHGNTKEPTRFACCFFS